MIRIEHLRFAYPGGANVLHIEAFEVAAGERVLVTGPSGCGKTTLLHLLAGLLVPTAGRVAVDGQDLAQLTPAARDRFRGRHVGIVLQQFHLLPTLTVLQNLLIAQRMAGLPVQRDHAFAMLKALDVDERPNARPHQLSVGQQQRVAIARALINRPRVLLADEPTSNIDDEACTVVAELLLKAARDHDVCLVVATHDSRLKARVERQLALPRIAAESPA